MECELMFMLAIWVANFNAFVRGLLRNGTRLGGMPSRLGAMSSRSVDMLGGMLAST